MFIVIFIYGLGFRVCNENVVRDCTKFLNAEGFRGQIKLRNTGLECYEVVANQESDCRGPRNK
jgi:hypothetical protein